MEWHHLAIYLVGLVSGYGICHFRPYKEKRKRTRAIPGGTKPTRAPRGPGRPRKAPEGPALPMD